jgi:hypothetical protein
MAKYFLAFIFILGLAACTKTETNIVPNNVPPPDGTIDSATIVIYLNKTYINMLGRKPVGSEQSAAMVTLRSHNFSVADRQAFVQTLFGRPEYNRTLFINAENLYLNNADSAEVAATIYLFQYELSQSPNNPPLDSALTFEIRRLDTLQATLNRMYAGLVDYRGMMRTILDNYMYDQINMGTQNFVTSSFQNFLLRYPTVSELSNGENMVNSTTAELFLVVGQSKEDYINIFFNSDDYIQGQVQLMFQNYLFRKPTSAEFAYYANIYKSTNDYKQLQLAIFSLNEYAGIK